MEKFLPPSRAASPATTRRALYPQGVSSRSRLRCGPVLMLAFCEGADLPDREPGTAYSIQPRAAPIIVLQCPVLAGFKRHWRNSISRKGSDDVEKGRQQN